MMFRLHLFFPFLILLAVMLLVTIISVTYIQENAIHSTKKSAPVNFSHFIEKSTKTESAMIAQYMRFIEERKDIQTAFQEHDKMALYRAVKNEYQLLHDSVEITHMYFILPSGEVLLRAHDFGKDKDIVNRATFHKAKESQSNVSGLEFGPQRRFTLRVVHPWYIDNRLIGYIELGKEIDNLLDNYTELIGTDIFLAVKKEKYQNASEEVKQNLNPNNFFSNYYVAYATAPLPDQMGDIINGSIDHSDIQSGNQDYYVTRIKATDFSGETVGYYIFLQNVSHEHSIVSNAVFMLTIILIIISAFFFGIGSLMIRKKEQEIYALTSELNAQKDELLLFNAKLQKLFDLQKNIVILTDGKRLMMANQAMFTFFGFRDLSHFLERYNCICDRFIEDDSFFHLGKVQAGKTWIDELTNLPQEKRIVAINDMHQISHIFHVAINEFEEGNFVVAFTDISNMMKEQIALLNQVVHDPLTGAYNREFLSKNVQFILKDTVSQKLGVIMCDIDYFKHVNDTYGHLCGDMVLQKFVYIIQESIRKEDYVIRWGGEEFILLIKIDSIESLQKVAEHIRRNIEEATFWEAQHITSSFGITLYIEGESIFEAIERADAALYQAKNQGRNQVRSM